jgi:hypothetical protein
MIGVGTIVKWTVIAGIVSTMAYGLNRLYEYHLDQIDEAVNIARLAAAAETQQAVNARDALLKEEARKDREVMERALKIERAKSEDLRRQLLIDHDLDRLLQNKEVLVLNIVNKGTAEVLTELEEKTQ